MAKQVSDASSMELSHYLTILRRRSRFVVAGVLLGVVVAGALVLLLPPRVTAGTQVNVNLISANAFNSQRPASDLLDMQTEEAMARSTAVMSAVADDLGGQWTKASVRRATSASLLPDGTVVRVEFTGSDAREAVDGASLVAEQYLAYRSAQAQERVDVASERLSERRELLTGQLRGANRRVAQAPQGSPEQMSEEMARQAITEELSAVTAQINELRAVNTSGGTVLTEADPQQVVTSPNRQLILASGLLGGTLLGLVLAFVANVLDRRVRDPYDVMGAGGGVTVARLHDPVASIPATGTDADDVRAVRERLLAAVTTPRPVLTVIDVGERGRAPSDVAPNLALALADSGMTTDLVLADHPPAALAQVVTALGLSEVEPTFNARRFRGASALTVVVPSVGENRVFTADVVTDLLADPARRAEVTVVGVAQAAGPAVRLSAARSCDQVVLVVEEMATRIDDLAGVATDLRAVWAQLHGTVLVPRGRHLAADTDGVDDQPLPAVVVDGGSDGPAGQDDGDGPERDLPVAGDVEGADGAVAQDAADEEVSAGEGTPEPAEPRAEVLPVEEPVAEPEAADDEVVAESVSEEAAADSGAAEAETAEAAETADGPTPDQEAAPEVASDGSASDTPTAGKPGGSVVANLRSWAFTR